MNALVPTAMPLQDMQTLAVAIAKSALFGIRTPEQALVLMAIAQAEGRHPVEAARDYDIINNRPAKKAEAMLRDFVKAGGTVKWHSLTDELADATFTHPQTGEVRIDWDMKRAMTAFGKKDMYTKFPRQMLRSRVVSEGVRTLWPLATSGMYVESEVAAMEQHTGPTLEHDARAAINAEVPFQVGTAAANLYPAQQGTMRAAAAATQQGERVVDPTDYSVTEPPPKSTPAIPRTPAQWNVWMDKFEATGAVLRTRRELDEIVWSPAYKDAYKAAPPNVQRDIDAVLAAWYERLPPQPVENDPKLGGDLPEVEIAGQDKVMSGDD